MPPTTHAIWASDPTFDFSGLLQESLGLEQLSAHQCFSLSPLTSLEPSPVLEPVKDNQAPGSSPMALSLEPSFAAHAEAKKTANHLKRQGHAARRRKRQSRRDQEPLGSMSAKVGKMIELTRPQTLSLDSSKLTIAKSGFVGAREKKAATVYHLEQLVGENSRFKFKLVQWDGSTPIPLVDNAGRIIGVLAGRPNDPTWAESCRKAAEAIEASRRQLTFDKGDRKHRQGHFPALAVGISHGGGQTQPGVLDHSKRNNKILRGITSNPAFVRIAGFGSSAFAAWAPRLHKYYRIHLRQLLDSDSRLFLNFANSIFACTTINFGPTTACFKHKDHNNLPFGWCAITSLGRFNPKKSGHLVLWEPKLVIEFPPGSTVLIPSSTLAHSNISVSAAQGETRYSFTQYTAGGLFRWVERGFVTDEVYFKDFSKEDKQSERFEVTKQLEMGLSLFSNVKEFNLST